LLGYVLQRRNFLKYLSQLRNAPDLASAERRVERFRQRMLRIFRALILVASSRREMFADFESFSNDILMAHEERQNAAAPAPQALPVTVSALYPPLTQEQDYGSPEYLPVVAASPVNLQATETIEEADPAAPPPYEAYQPFLRRTRRRLLF
jgi:hypothetical protein